MSFKYKGKVYELVQQTQEERSIPYTDSYCLCYGCAFYKDNAGCAAAPNCATNDDGIATYLFKEVTQSV